MKRLRRMVALVLRRFGIGRWWKRVLLWGGLKERSVVENF